MSTLRNRDRWAALAPGALLGLVILVALGGAIGADFVWDDHPLIVENRMVKDPGEVLKVFTSSFWETGDRHDRFRSFFRPLVSFSYAVDHALWGLRPLPFHVTNLILHWLCACLVYWLARQENLARAPALLGASLFAAHPVHVESVAWISGRTDVLCAVFMLAAFACHRSRSGRGWRQVLGWLLFLAALLAKEMAATLPLLIFAERWLQAPGTIRRRIAAGLRAAAPFLVVLAAYMVLRHQVLGAGAAPLFNLDRVGYAATTLFVYARYLTLLLLPVGLDAHYPYKALTSLAAPLTVVAALIVAVALAGTARLAQRSHPALLWSGWVFVTLLPVMAFGRFGDVLMADRFLYIPSAGFALLLAQAFAWLAPQSGRELTPRRLAAVAGGGAYLCVLVALSLLRTQVWRSDRTLFADMLRTSPDSALVHCNMGLTLYKDGELAAAVREFERSIALVPSYTMAHNNLGAVLERQKRYSEALTHYSRALHLAPLMVEARINAGHLLVALGRKDEGFELLQMIVADYPRHPGALSALAHALYMRGEREAAIPYLERARRADASQATVHYLLGKIRHEQGREKEAAAAMRRFLDLWPEQDAYRAAALRIVAGADGQPR